MTLFSHPTYSYSPGDIKRELRITGEYFPSRAFLYVILVSPKYCDRNTLKLPV